MFLFVLLSALVMKEDRSGKGEAFHSSITIGIFLFPLCQFFLIFGTKAPNLMGVVYSSKQSVGSSCLGISIQYGKS